MGEKELRTKYGGKLDKAINRAIRAEVQGGNEALDKLTQLAGSARHSRWKDHAGRDTPEAAAYFKHQKDVVGRMEADVRRRWGVPPGAGAGKPAGRPKSPARKSTRPKAKGRTNGTPPKKGRLA